MSDEKVIKLKIGSKKPKAKVPVGTEFIDEFGLTDDELKKQKEIEKRNLDLQEKFNEGFKEGYNRAKSEMEREFTDELVLKSKEYYSIISELENKYLFYEENFNKIIIESAIQIAEKIIHREVENKSTIEETLSEAVQKIIGANKVVIKLHPHDNEYLNSLDKNNLFEHKFSKVQFEPDESIEKGECFIETEIGNVDARLSTQLDEIKKALERKLIEKG